MQKEADFNAFKQAKVVLNLYLEEIHVITRNEGLLSLYQLEGKKVAVGPQRSGSALSAEVLLAGYICGYKPFSTRRIMLWESSKAEKSMPFFLSAARLFPRLKTWTIVFV